MSRPASRREFLSAAASAAAVLGAGSTALGGHHAGLKEGHLDGADEKPLFEISLAEWSLHETLFAGKITNLDFPVVAREEFDIAGIEYVNRFFEGKQGDESYMNELKGRCDGAGVESLLVMVDGEGKLGAPEESARKQTVENHKKWLGAAAELGCHSIRVNAGSAGSFTEQLEYAADGLRRLGEVAEPYGLNVLVENHGGLSSNAAWLACVMERAGHELVGTLPDFGNFRIRGSKKNPTEVYDRYKGVAQLMPYAKAVSAKSYDFDEAGEERTLDYARLIGLVTGWGYDGWIGIEYEGKRLGEYEGVRATKVLLERVRATLGAHRSLG